MHDQKVFLAGILLVDWHQVLDLRVLKDLLKQGIFLDSKGTKISADRSDEPSLHDVL